MGRSFSAIKYICAGCETVLACECHSKGNEFWADDGDQIYCNVCDFTASESFFKGFTNEKKEDDL